MSQTKTSQRILFAVILLLMVISTIGLYIGSALGFLNPSDDKKQEQQSMLETQEKIAAYAKWRQALADKYSAQYYEQFRVYKNVNQAYNAASITELKTKDLQLGEGEELKEATAYQAYYIGWLPDGTVFDSSFDGDKLKAPIAGGNLIAGWNEGVLGMKIGGVRELSIPANKAYGEAGSGQIPANSPIKFVVMIIPTMTAEEKAAEPSLD